MTKMLSHVTHDMAMPIAIEHHRMPFKNKKRDEMKEKLKIYLLTFFTEAETALICSNFNLVELIPDQVLIDANSTTNLVGFVAEGILKAVEPLENGKEVIHYFWDENNFFSEADSYFNNTSTRFSVAAAIDCTLLCTTKEKLDALEQKIPTLGGIRKTIGAQTMLEKSKMQEATKQGAKEARYLWFLNHYPSLAKRLSIKDMALFLGSTPNYLSSIRNKIVKK